MKTVGTRNKGNGCSTYCILKTRTATTRLGSLTVLGPGIGIEYEYERKLARRLGTYESNGQLQMGHVQRSYSGNLVAFIGYRFFTYQRPVKRSSIVRLFDCTAGRRGRFIKNEKSYPQNWYEFLRPIKLKNSSIRYPHYRLSGHSHGRRFSTEYTRKGEQVVRYSYFNIGRIEKLHRRQAEYYERRRHCDGESLRNSLFPSSVLDNFQIFVDYKTGNKIERSAQTKIISQK